MATNAPHTQAAAASTGDLIVTRAIAGDSTSRISRDLGVPLTTVRAALYANARLIR